MLQKAREIEGFELRARDGQIGHVSDFFFDDRRWTVRYFVVDTGAWLDHREVLIAPTAVCGVDLTQRLLSVDLTSQQVRESPAVDPTEPISREQELLLTQYYSWPMYWTGAGFGDPLLMSTPPFLPVNAPRPVRSKAVSSLDEEHHIRSVDDVRGHRIEANDGMIGHVDEFLLDDRDWSIAYLVVDTRNWWPGKRVLISPEWIFEVGWSEAKVFVDLSREAIRRSPEYDPTVPPTRDYTDELHAHYGQPRRSAEP
jgi:hypothetical protein